MKYIHHRSGPYITSQTLKLLRTLKEHDYLKEFQKRYLILQDAYHCYQSPITNFMNSYSSHSLIEWFSRTQMQEQVTYQKLIQTYNEIHKRK